MSGPNPYREGAKTVSEVPCGPLRSLVLAARGALGRRAGRRRLERMVDFLGPGSMPTARGHLSQDGRRSVRFGRDGVPIYEVHCGPGVVLRVGAPLRPERGAAGRSWLSGALRSVGVRPRGWEGVEDRSTNL